MGKVKIGIIGGTGIDDPSILQDRASKSVETPFGKPSDDLVTGKIHGVECVLLFRAKGELGFSSNLPNRHGRRHNILPSRVNYRANIYALKAEGCTHVLVTTACGSLREEFAPGDLVLVDQFIDRTHKRENTFFDGSCAEFSGICHLPMRTPFCEHTRKLLEESIRDLGIKHHDKGTIIAVEGPRFSTRAESLMFRVWGADLINMTSVPEVPLAKEAGLCYAAMALVTDYDCWRETDDAEHVSARSVFAMMKQNAEKATKVLLDVIPKIAERNWDDIVKSCQDEVKSNTF